MRDWDDVEGSFDGDLRFWGWFDGGFFCYGGAEMLRGGGDGGAGLVFAVRVDVWRLLLRRG